MDYINELSRLEAVADLLIEGAAKLKKECAQAREKMTGVSTPVLIKGRKNKSVVDPKKIADIVSRRNKNLIKKYSTG